jgi:transposase InsO family protein
MSEQALLVHVKAVHAQSRGSYGRPRILRQLKKDDVRVGKERLQQVMQENGIVCKAKRRFRVTTDSNHSLPIAPNVNER